MPDIANSATATNPLGKGTARAAGPYPPTSKAAPKKESDAGSNKTVKGFRFLSAWALSAFGVYQCFVGPNSGRVHKAMYSYTADGPETQPLDHMYIAFACIGFCGLFDTMIAARFGGARYFVLHVAVNCVTVYHTWGDFVHFFTSSDPFSLNSCSVSGTHCANKLALDLTVGIHLWHSLAYALKPIDWVHHLPAHVVGACGILFPFGPVLNAVCVMLMGIPGGLDYLLLVFVKLGMLPSLTEKNLNQKLNVWMRCPLAAYCGVVMVMGLFVRPQDFVSKGHMAGHFIMGAHAYWNGCFFMYRTVDARTRFVEKLKAEKKAKAT